LLFFGVTTIQVVFSESAKVFVSLEMQPSWLQSLFYKLEACGTETKQPPAAKDTSWKLAIQNQSNLRLQKTKLESCGTFFWYRNHPGCVGCFPNQPFFI